MPVTFLEFPAEIRNAIYPELLVGSDRILLMSAPPSRITGSSSRFPEILRTCKQVYSEAVHYLYSGNFIAFSMMEEQYPFVAKFFNLIGAHNTASLQHVGVPWPPFYIYSTRFRHAIGQRPGCSMQVINLIRNRCISLDTLELTGLPPREGYYVNSDETRRHFREMDVKLRAISSLKDIAITMPCLDSLTKWEKKFGAMLLEMGWTVKYGEVKDRGQTRKITRLARK